jgi:23S rRNA pseudouridine1911/1915/1917 synthase
MQQVLEFRCDGTTAGERLDLFLVARVGGLSRMRIAQLLEAGACAVNDETGVPGQHLRAGDLISFALDPSARTAMTPEPLPLEIVYEDDELLVVNKPAGLLVHPTRSVKSGTLANALTYHLNRKRLAEVAWQNENAIGAQLHLDQPQGAGHKQQAAIIRPGIVHRLDRATSGLLVIAKTQRALSILTRHFHRRLVAKRYLALVAGCVAADVRVVDAPIGRDAEARPQWRVSATGRQAHTILRVNRRSVRATLVELEPTTGRTNQLRIHMAHIGHAIIGDEWYGADREVPQMKADDTSSAFVSERLCLHAARLAFNHPTGGRWMEFSTPLPAAMMKTCAALGVG